MSVFETNNFLIDFTFSEEPFILDNLRLYQVGKKFCNSNTVIGEHPHEGWFEITVILDGKGKVYANDESTDVQQGDLFLSYPAETHNIVTDPNSPIKYSFLSFCLEKNDYKKEFEKITRLFPNAKERVFSDENVTFLIDQIIGELLTNSFEKETVISLALQQILLLIIRTFLHTQSKKSAPNYANKNEILCHQIMQYINRNLFSLRNLTELSEHLNYNYSYLAKIFKQTTHTTIMQYYTERKLQCAKALIKEGALTFTEISELLNFASIYSFSKSFKFHFGLSPIDYKRSLKTPDNRPKKVKGAKSASK